MGKFYQTFKEELISIHLKLLQKIEERTLLNSFYKVSITLIPKPDEDTKEKKTCRPTSLMNTDAKIILKILANQIQLDTKKFVLQEQVGFLPGR